MQGNYTSVEMLIKAHLKNSFLFKDKYFELINIILIGLKANTQRQNNIVHSSFKYYMKQYNFIPPPDTFQNLIKCSNI